MTTYDVWKADESCSQCLPDPCAHGFALDEHCPECDGPSEPPE